MRDTLMNEGLTLMLAGMGTVFVFLATLVLVMSMMSLLVRPTSPASGDVSDEEVAAISAAIARHRRS